MGISYWGVKSWSKEFFSKNLKYWKHIVLETQDIYLHIIPKLKKSIIISILVVVSRIKTPLFIIRFLNMWIMICSVHSLIIEFECHLEVFEVRFQGIAFQSIIFRPCTNHVTFNVFKIELFTLGKIHFSGSIKVKPAFKKIVRLSILKIVANFDVSICHCRK